jgi:predicted metalloprotease
VAALALTLTAGGGSAGASLPGGSATGAPGTAQPSAPQSSEPAGTPTLSEQELAERLDQYQPEQGQGSSAFQGDTVGAVTPEAVGAYLAEVMASTDAYWDGYFAEIGAQEPLYFYAVVAPGQTFESNCQEGRIGADTPNSYYCPADFYTDDRGVEYAGSVVLPLTTFADMWAGNIFDSGADPDFKGDFAAAAIAAHERGHEVQHELQVQYGLPDIVQSVNGSTVRLKEKELIADCFSGNWANYAYQQNYLVGTDVEEAVAALDAIGDTSQQGSDPHGSPEERAEAFMLGYNTGAPYQCMKQYWVTVDWRQ